MATEREWRAVEGSLHRYEINGVPLLAYDEDESLTADRVACELLGDVYGLESVPFQPGDVVIDVGAHVGLVSMYLAKRWPFLRIDAFEPYGANYANCAENLRANDVSNVRLFRQAVTADGRSIILRSLSSNTGGATAVFDMPGAVAAAPVDSTTLHEIFERTLLPGQRCRLLKMDCEGMEYEILPQSRVLDRIDFLAADSWRPSCTKSSLPGSPATLSATLASLRSTARGSSHRKGCGWCSARNGTDGRSFLATHTGREHARAIAALDSWNLRSETSVKETCHDQTAD